MIVKETIDFKRGISTKAALQVGVYQQIEDWLQDLSEKDEIGTWVINDDYSITVKGKVDLRGNWHGNLPDYINFKEVLKDETYDSKGERLRPFTFFSAVGIGLTSLKGMPERIEGDFAISRNYFGNLMDCPKYIGGSFHMEEAGLKNLEGAPDYVGKDVYTFGNPGDFYDIDIRRAIKTIKGSVHLAKRSY